MLLDALGTLVELQPPAPRLRRLLRESGFEVSEEQAAAGFMAEIAYYLDHHLDGSDPERLERLRDRCADEMRSALGSRARPRDGAAGDAGRARVHPLSGRGARAARAARARDDVVIASNWDCSLPEWLRPRGSSSWWTAWSPRRRSGAAKPSPRVFERALGIAGVDPAEALHVGDKVDNDIEGAAAAGVRGVLLQREGDPPRGGGVDQLASELPALL